VGDISEVLPPPPLHFFKKKTKNKKRGGLLTKNILSFSHANGRMQAQQKKISSYCITKDNHTSTSKVCTAACSY